MQERIGIAGSGTIACGLAVAAARHGDVLLWARSDQSADRARASIARICARAEPPMDEGRVRVVRDIDDLREASFLVEAIVEHHGSKAQVLSDLGELEHHAGANAVLATTTSSLSVVELAHASGHPERFVALHVFNPVPRMELVELAFPPEASAETRDRARTLCADLGKTAVEVPDIPGFVVNRLLFPYLFSAVRLMAETGMDPGDIDQCMMLGTGAPMGPFALLDLIGLDVSRAIGEAIAVDVPQELVDRVDEGWLGRKTKKGFYTYD